MGLREHLEEQLKKDYEQLKEYEDALRYEIDPLLKGKWNARIKELKRRMHEREQDLRHLSIPLLQPKKVLEKRLSLKEGGGSVLIGGTALGLVLIFNGIWRDELLLFLLGNGIILIVWLIVWRERILKYVQEQQRNRNHEQGRRLPKKGDEHKGNLYGSVHYLSTYQRENKSFSNFLEGGVNNYDLHNLEWDSSVEKAKPLPLLSDIPVTGYEASEVGEDYATLQHLLDKKEFGRADLETARKILWVTKRENYGFLDVEDIQNFPSKDLRTINQLWLAASDGKFGFSVQKQIWIGLGDQLRQYDDDYIFEQFLKKVEWAENKAICFDQRATKGHLPMGMYVKVSNNLRINQKWWVEIDKIVKTEQEEIRRLEEEIRRLEEEKEEEKRQRDSELSSGKSANIDTGENASTIVFEPPPPSYLFLLSRSDL